MGGGHEQPVHVGGLFDCGRRASGHRDGIGWLPCVQHVRLVPDWVVWESPLVFWPDVGETGPKWIAIFPEKGLAHARLDVQENGTGSDDRFGTSRKTERDRMTGLELSGKWNEIKDQMDCLDLPGN